MKLKSPVIRKRHLQFKKLRTDGDSRTSTSNRASFALNCVVCVVATLHDSRYRGVPDMGARERQFQQYEQSGIDVHSPYGTAMQLNGTTRDCKPQPNATGVAIAGIINTVEGSEYLTQCLLRNAGTVVSDTDSSCTFVLRKVDLDAGVGG